MTGLRHFVQNIQDRFFDSIVTNHLVYNTCWEDPQIDRQLLDIDSNSSIVTLTSAGCNALDYLLDDPKSVYAIDANPNQNALLELKQALFNLGDYDLLFDFFGTGSHSAAPSIYNEYLKTHLSPSARQFWDRNINYFIRTPLEPSFYFRGTSGKIALFTHQHIKHKELYGKTLNLLDSSSLAEQRYYFNEIETLFWSGFYRWLLKQNSTMTLLGVPPTQRDLIDKEFDGGLYHYIRKSIEHVFTRLPIRNNYFWRVYITGSYTRGCCPNYLKEENFEYLGNRMDRIYLDTSTLSDFLEKNPGSYSHFVLLDHQDWMANSQPKELSREWKLILENARPGARVLFRSASSEVRFVPEFVYDSVDFMHDLTNELHQKDRVGTYGSTHLGVIG